ncbi:hypothetical protein [Roseobacter ponti]|uniref:Aminoglycoside phosphotransferase domain-containing protein n=1 Tax=Roseobacter ponti TaxID=1891787 RepID=A0A858SSE9_9RHOB|nr:hypothetical protein [Roseobacter ponti]QJF51595.1 hypothetical protein G3256_10695 [Roseobacter ponti]
MKSDFDAYITGIAKDVSGKLGNSLDVSTTRWIRPPTGEDQVRDATLAFYVDGHKRGDDVVLLISNTLFPGAVKADVACARDVAGRVSRQVSAHISAPVCEGQSGKQTYAAYSRLSPLSEFRPVRMLQKARAAKQTLPWLVQLAKETRLHRGTPEDYERVFADPLASLGGDTNVPARVRARAQEYRDFVQDRKPDLFTVVQHGDFWIGNVFFERRKLPDLNPYLGDFSIIDWRGARQDGYPCTDCMRFCSSLFRTGSERNSQLIAEYRSALDIPAEEFQVYCFLALGRLGTELDQFPAEKYAELCDHTLTFIDTHCPR